MAEENNHGIEFLRKLLFGKNPEAGGGADDRGETYGIDVDELFSTAEYDLPEAADPEIQKIYDGVHIFFRTHGFYGDPRSAQVILYRLADILSADSSSRGMSKEDILKTVRDVYVSIQTRAMMIDMYRTPKAVIESVMGKWEGRFPEKVTAAFLKESLRFIYNHDPKLKNNTRALMFIENYQKENAADNGDAEDRYLDDPGYGLKPEKPVFVNGFPSLHYYLDHLRAPDGQQLENDRRGSVIVKGIRGPVDVYDLFLPGRRFYMTIYICLYGSKMSAAAPHGLKFIG